VNLNLLDLNLFASISLSAADQRQQLLQKKGENLLNPAKF
jgi:hypothetical protein